MPAVQIVVELGSGFVQPAGWHGEALVNAEELVARAWAPDDDDDDDNSRENSCFKEEKNYKVLRSDIFHNYPHSFSASFPSATLWSVKALDIPLKLLISGHALRKFFIDRRYMRMPCLSMGDVLHPRSFFQSSTSMCILFIVSSLSQPFPCNRFCFASPGIRYLYNSVRQNVTEFA